MRHEVTWAEITDMRNITITAVFATLIFGMPLLPLLAQDTMKHESTPPAGHQMTMGGMMGMMEECQKNCDTMAAARADLAKSIADARTSNDVATLRGALDQVQAGLTKMEEKMKDCHGMMHKP
jgi:uncharacterized membrane protein YccC